MTAAPDMFTDASLKTHGGGAVKGAAAVSKLSVSGWTNDIMSNSEEERL